MAQGQQTASVFPTTPPAQLSFVGVDQSGTEQDEVPAAQLWIKPELDLPSALSESVSVSFEDASLSTLVAWLRDDLGLSVHWDEHNLDNDGISRDDRFSDSLNDQPAVQLLDRLDNMGIHWLIDDGHIVLTTETGLFNRSRSEAYYLGDLRDLGFRCAEVSQALTFLTYPEAWTRLGGESEASLFDDVVSVWGHEYVHREVEMLLKALRLSNSVVWLDESEANEAIWKALELRVECQFPQATLGEVIAAFAAETGVGILLDRSVELEGISKDTQVSIELDRPRLGTALRYLLERYACHMLVTDGQLTLVSESFYLETTRLAVFNFPDLCADQESTDRLQETIRQTIRPLDWEEMGGFATSVSLKPGQLCVRASQVCLRDIATMIDRLRTTGPAGRQRNLPDYDMQEMTTVYYIVNSAAAQDLERVLPLLIEPASWKSESNPAGGEVFRVASYPGTFDSTAAGWGVKFPPPNPVTETPSTDESPTSQPAASQTSVIVVRQSRAVQRKVRGAIERIYSGDLPFGPDFGESRDFEVWQSSFGIISGWMGPGFLRLPPEKLRWPVPLAR